jgi:HAD superfamily hydrolase (TIGR01490 family)
MQGEKFAVFDIDGTLIRWQLYHAVVDGLAKQGLLDDKSKQKLHEARMRWKRREHAESFPEYEQTIIEVYVGVLKQITTDQFDQTVEKVIDEYKEQTYTYTRDLVRELKKQGYILLVVSGSQQELVDKIAEAYGFDFALGSSYERAQGRFTGKSEIIAKDKRKALRRLIDARKLDAKASIGVGDTHSDIPMLEIVEQPIAFNPDQRLFDHARKHGWKIVVERKNVVYELEEQDGKYVLS